MKNACVVESSRVDTAAVSPESGSERRLPQELGPHGWVDRVADLAVEGDHSGPGKVIMLGADNRPLFARFRVVFGPAASAASRTSAPVHAASIASAAASAASIASAPVHAAPVHAASESSSESSTVLEDASDEDDYWSRPGDYIGDYWDHNPLTVAELLELLPGMTSDSPVAPPPPPPLLEELPGAPPPLPPPASPRPPLEERPAAAAAGQWQGHRHQGLSWNTVNRSWSWSKGKAPGKGKGKDGRHGFHIYRSR